MGPPYLNRNTGPRTALAVLAAVVCLAALAGGARAAGEFYIRGGGDGHGIGMSQYGAYGYAQHGAGYQAILAHYYTATALGHTNPARTIRVLVATGTASFSGAGTAGGTRLDPTSTYTVHALANGSLDLRGPSGKTLGHFAAPLTVGGAGALTVSGAGTYDGDLEFRPDGAGGVETINAVGLDEYVRGVVAGEMPSSWPAAALEAQAVAARTYAITATVGAAGFDLYDDTRSQVYGGVRAHTPSTDAAVKATSGQIVTYDGRPAVTYFFASSGGHTESIQDAWPGSTPEPWLRGVPDPYDAAGGDPYHRWGEQMTAAAAAAKLGALVKGRLIGIAVTRHGTSPRIVEAEVVGTRGRSQVTGAQLQSVFDLDSTYAGFTTIFATPGSSRLTGSVFPSPAHGIVSIQRLQGGAWRSAGQAKLSRTGTFSARVAQPGRYRPTYGSLAGPSVTVR